jgi:hypothetical protein
MWCIVSTTEEDLGELKRRARLGFFCNGAYFIEFLLDFRAAVSSDVFENFFGFGRSANGSEVSRRVWKKLDTCEEEKCWQALEGEEETPSDC